MPPAVWPDQEEKTKKEPLEMVCIDSNTSQKTQRWRSHTGTKGGTICSVKSHATPGDTYLDNLLPPCKPEHLGPPLAPCHKETLAGSYQLNLRNFLNEIKNKIDLYVKMLPDNPDLFFSEEKQIADQYAA